MGQALPGGLRGNVQEMGSQMPLEYALVTVDDSQPGETSALSAYTNSDGYFQINGIPEGTYQVSVKLAGFGTLQRSVTVKSGRIGFERFLLEESTVILDDVVIDVSAKSSKPKTPPHWSNLALSLLPPSLSGGNLI